MLKVTHEGLELLEDHFNCETVAFGDQIFILTHICGPLHRCLGKIKSALASAHAACKEAKLKYFQLGSVTRFKTCMQCHLMFMFVKTLTMHCHQDEICNADLKTMINFATSHWCASEKEKMKNVTH